MAVVSRIPIMHGYADLLLLVIASWGLHEKAKNIYFCAILAGLFVSFISAQPFPLSLITYLIIAWMTRLMHGNIWQSPILAMMLITIFGTLIQHITMILYLQLSEIPIPFQVSLQQVTLPSIIFNIILILPIYFVVRDIQKYVYKDEVYE